MKKLILIIAIVFSGMLMQAQEATITGIGGSKIHADSIISVDGYYVTYIIDNYQYSLLAVSILYADSGFSQVLLNNYNNNYKNYYTPANNAGRQMKIAGLIVTGVGVLSGIGAIIQSNRGQMPFLRVPAVVCISVGLPLTFVGMRLKNR